MPLAYILSLLSFITLIPLGIYVGIWCYRLMKRQIKVGDLVQVPYHEKEGVFTITKAGNYSVWQRGILRTRAPLDEFIPLITNLDTGERVELSRSLMSASINGGKYASSELFNFRAEVGNYKLEIVSGSSMSFIEMLLLKFTPIRLVASRLRFDLDNYSLFVRPRFNKLLFMISIWMIFLSIALIVGGLIIGFNVEAIFNL